MPKYKHLPLNTITSAVDGDEKAIQKVLKHYEGYITKLSLRTMVDEYGNTYMVIDTEMKGRIQSALMKMISNFQVVVV